MPNLSQSPSIDKGRAAVIEPTAIAALRTQPLHRSAWDRESAYAVDTTDGRTIEVSLSEWRALIKPLLAMPDRRLVHRHLGLDIESKGILLEVVQ